MLLLLLTDDLTDGVAAGLEKERIRSPLKGN